MALNSVYVYYLGYCQARRDVYSEVGELHSEGDGRLLRKGNVSPPSALLLHPFIIHTHPRLSTKTLVKLLSPILISCLDSFSSASRYFPAQDGSFDDAGTILKTPHEVALG